MTLDDLSAFELSSSSRFWLESDSRGEEGMRVEFSWRKEGEKVPTENCGRGTCSTFGSTCNSFELKPIPHMAEAVSWFLRFQMRACVLLRYASATVRHLFDVFVRPVHFGGEGETKTNLIVNISRDWCCFGGKIIFRTRKHFDPFVVWGYFEIQFQRNSKIIHHYWILKFEVTIIL